MKTSFRRTFFSTSSAFLLLLSALSLPLSKAAADTWINTPFVITDSSSYHPDDIWVEFSGTVNTTSTAQTAGNATFASGVSWQSFKLSDLLANVSSVPYFDGKQAYTFSLNNFSGRIYISYGQELTAPPTPGAPGTTPYAVVETTVNGLKTTGVDSSNIDLSYVDGVSVPITTTLRSGTGTVLAATSINPVATSPAILANVAAMVPSAAVVKNGGGDIVRVESSAANPAAYHDWSSLMTALQTKTAAAPLNVSSYTAPSGGIPAGYGIAGSNFGFSGAPAISGQAANFDQKQNYVSTATFKTDLNPNGDDATLAGLGIGKNTAGVVISGNGTTIPGGGTPAGDFRIYITEAALNAGTGIYGSNPAYVVVTGTGTSEAGYQTTGIVNDLGGRIVGDLLAGIVFGWSNSTKNIAQWATQTGTNLYGTAFSSATVGGLSSGEYFYLLSLAGAQGKLTDWIGANIDSNANDYDQYAYAIAQNSNAYGTGFGDRLQGVMNPNTYWYTANPPANPSGGNYDTIGYVQINSVPEPSAFALLLLGIAALLWNLRRRNKTAVSEKA